MLVMSHLRLTSCQSGRRATLDFRPRSRHAVTPSACRDRSNRFPMALTHHQRAILGLTSFLTLIARLTPRKSITSHLHRTAIQMIRNAVRTVKRLVQVHLAVLQQLQADLAATSAFVILSRPFPAGRVARFVAGPTQPILSYHYLLLAVTKSIPQRVAQLVLALTQAQLRFSSGRVVMSLTK